MKRVYIAVLVLVVLSLLFLPALAEARGGHGGGHGGGRCGHGKGHGGFRGGYYGGWYGGVYLAPPVYEAYPMCYETIPEHWESQWNPEVQGYVDVYVPEQIIAVPCP
ncbi:MAG: hypothetical protein ABSB32_20660 [Thermodesulfobacteriota bacterium]